MPIILVLSIVKFTIQLVGNRNYGFHRDELLHLAVSEHLDWDFMEFPPLIGFIGKLAYFLDYALLISDSKESTPIYEMSQDE